MKASAFGGLVVACWHFGGLVVACWHFGGLVVACWHFVPKFVGSHPAENVGFLGRKNPQHAFLRKGSKPIGSMSHVTCKPAFRQNHRTFFAHSSTFRRWVLSRGDTRGDAWWRKLERLTQIAQ